MVFAFILHYLLTFSLQIVYRKMRNLQIGVEKACRKGVDKFIAYTKAAYIINIIIKVPTVAFKCSSLSYQLLNTYYLAIVSKIVRFMDTFSKSRNPMQKLPKITPCKNKN